MICLNCKRQNVEGASYCARCGKPLGLICDCSFVNQPDDLFCGGCGISLTEPLATRKNSAQKRHYLVKQLDKREVAELIKESIFFKTGEEKNLDQSEIDNIFILELGEKKNK